MARYPGGTLLTNGDMRWAHLTFETDATSPSIGRGLIDWNPRSDLRQRPVVIGALWPHTGSRSALPSATPRRVGVESPAGWPISIMPDNVITLDWRNAEHRAAAAQLVLTLLPRSPAGVLGRRFLTEFYFLDLIRDGEMECLLYSSQGRYVGFSLYTDNPFGFIRNGVRRHFVKLGVLVGRSLMANPRRLAVIFNVTKQGRYRATHGADTKVGELLSFGILESHRQEVDPGSEMRLPAHLFRVALTRLRDRGLAVAQLVTDKDNLPAQAFFMMNGGTVDPTGYCFDDSILFKFDLDRILPGDACATPDQATALRDAGEDREPRRLAAEREWEDRSIGLSATSPRSFVKLPPTRPPQEILAELNEVFVRLFNNPRMVVTESTTAKDIAEWDSLNHVKLILGVEAQFQIKFSLKEVMRFENVGDICAAIAFRLDRMKDA